MMSYEEAVDLLSFAATYDSRKPNAAVVNSWMEAAERGRWNFDEAVEAVHEHYARTTQFLMPGHITEAVRVKRAQPIALPEQRRKEIGRPAPAAPETVRSCMEQVARELGWDQEMDRRSVLAVPCPWCRASPGDQCTRPARRQGEEARTPLQRPHPARVEAAEDRELEREAAR
jgi:heterodisulfide reductase subunit B